MPELTNLKYIEIDPAKLRAIRESQGRSQTWVAAQIDVSKALYSMYERGVNRPTYETVERICKLFDVTITDIADMRAIANTLDVLKRVGKLYGLEIRAA